MEISKRVTKEKSKCFVIDACIARSAGGEDTSHPTGKNCRDFLRYVLDICHKMILTPEIREEWRSHKSKFATEWLVSMHARKKIIDLDSSCRKNEIREKISSLEVSDKEIEAMTKDIHLLEAALVCDKIVVSTDKKARSLFLDASKVIGQIREIAWRDPTEFPEEIKIWLQEGAQVEEDQLLGYRK